jgi:hypothetical protein
MLTVILAPQEAENRRKAVQGQPWTNSSQNTILKITDIKKVWWSSSSGRA